MLQIGILPSTKSLEIVLQVVPFTYDFQIGFPVLSEDEKDKIRIVSITPGSIEAVLAKLKEQGLVDDMAFAQFWKDNRESFKPRSQWLTKLELRCKGVANNIIDQIANSIDDEDSAYRAALSKARSLPLSDYQGFRRRLGDYLKRRGFGYGVINQTIERLWQELGGKDRQ